MIMGVTSGEARDSRSLTLASASSRDSSVLASLARSTTVVARSSTLVARSSTIVARSSALVARSSTLVARSSRTEQWTYP